jgi:hypothetical protein
VDPALDFATSIIMDSDLSDLTYLYSYGDYISEVEIETAKFLNSLTEEEIKLVTIGKIFCSIIIDFIRPLIYSNN